MPIDILMPALSPTMEEGTLAKWFVKVGDKVSSGDVIAEIETDKATMEVEAVDEGVVEEILVAEGTEEVKVNAPIARLSGEGASTPAPAAAAAKAEPAKAEAPVAKAPEPAAPKPAQAAPVATGTGERVFASPLARRMDKDAGVDLGQVKGSGPHGRIIRRDVEGLKGSPQPAAAAVKPPKKSARKAPVARGSRSGSPQ